MDKYIGDYFVRLVERDIRGRKRRPPLGKTSLREMPVRNVSVPPVSPKVVKLLRDPFGSLLLPAKAKETRVPGRSTIRRGEDWRVDVEQVGSPLWSFTEIRVSVKWADDSKAQAASERLLHAISTIVDEQWRSTSREALREAKRKRRNPFRNRDVS